MTDPQKVVSQTKEALKDHPSVAALVLVGTSVSAPGYKASEYSDVEIYVVVEDAEVAKVEEDLIQIVLKMGKIVFHYKNQWAGLSFVFEDLKRLELPIVKSSAISSVFSRPKAQPVEVLIDKTNGELDEVLAKRPETVDYEKLFGDQITDFWYMAITCVQYFKKGEHWNARHLQQVILAPKVVLFLQFNENPKILLLERNKRVEEFLPEEKLKILENISCRYSGEEEIKRALLETMEVFDEYSDKITQKHGYQKPEFVKEVRGKLEQLLKGN